MKKYSIFLLLLLISLTCVTASDTTSDISDNSQVDIQDLNADTYTEDIQVTHHVNTSEKLHDVLSDLNNIQSSQSHIIELDDNISVDEDIDNEYLTLIINGNNNQLTVNKLILSNAVNVTLNNMTLELNSNINNWVNLYLNNVTIKSTNLYDNITKTLADNGIEEYNESNYDKICEIFEGVNTNHGNIHNYKNLYVNNSVFTKTMAHTGSAIYNHEYLNVDNTIFNNTLSVFGVVFSEGPLSVTNSIFTSNKQCGYLLHTNSGEMLSINNSFTDNYALYNSGISNFGTSLVEGCNFTNNTASSMNSISNDGNMTVKSCIFKDNNGEVIVNYGNLTVSDSMIEDNEDELFIISNNYVYDNETEEIIRIGKLTMLNNSIVNNTCNKLIYNGASLVMLNNSIYNVNNLLYYDQPGDYILDELMDDVDTTEFNRSVSIESNTFIIDSEGVIDELIINNQSNYVQHTPRDSVILLNPIRNATEGDYVIISGFLTDNNNKAITDNININISDYAYSVESTDEDGYFIYVCTPAVGTYTVVVSYNQCKYIKASNVTATFTINESETEYDINTTDESDLNITDDETHNDTEDSNITDINDTIVDNKDHTVDIVDGNLTDTNITADYSDKTNDGSLPDSRNQNTTIPEDTLNNNKSTDYIHIPININKQLNIRNQIKKLVNNDLLQVTSPSAVSVENNTENNENTTTADNSSDEQTTVDKNNQVNNNPSNNQSNNIIPIAAAFIGAIAIIGVVIIKK